MFVEKIVTATRREYMATSIIGQEIVEINKKQNAIKVTSPSGDNATFETGGYFTIGKVVIVDITLVVSSSGATIGTKLIKELPAPTQNDKPLFGMMMGSVNNNLVSFRLYADGLYPNSNIGAGRYHVYGCYTTF